MDIQWRNFHATGLLERLERDFDKIYIVGPRKLEPGVLREPTESVADRWLLSDPILNWLSEVHKIRTILENTHYPEHNQKLFLKVNPRDYFLARYFYWPLRMLGYAGLFLRVLLALPRIRRMAPTAIVSNSFVWGAFDNVLGMYAKLRGIPWVSIITGWDNPSTKGRFMLLPKRVIVWGEKNREDCSKYQCISPARVLVLPPPQLTRLRAVVEQKPSTKKHIAYIGVTTNNYTYEPEFVELLIKVCREAGVLEKLPLVLRPHPNDSRSWADRFSGIPGVSIDPGALNRSSQWTVFTAEREGLDEYYRLLRDSAFVVTHYSTAMVEAGLMGVPSIIPRVAFPAGKPFHTRLDFFPHTMELRNSPGLPAVGNEAELKQAVLRLAAGLGAEDRETHFKACERISAFPPADLLDRYSSALSSQL